MGMSNTDFGHFGEHLNPIWGFMVRVQVKFSSSVGLLGFHSNKFSFLQVREQKKFTEKYGLVCEDTQDFVHHFGPFLVNTNIPYGFYGQSAPLWSHLTAWMCAIYEFEARKSRNHVLCAWLHSFTD